MKFIETICKVCREKVVVHYDDAGMSRAELATLQEAVARFLPLVCCSQCYSTHDKRQRTGKVIQDACVSLSRVPAEKQSASLREQVRETLKTALPKYAEAIAEQYRSPVSVYHESAVDLLMAHPEKVSDILRQWRDATRRQAAGEAA